MTDETTTKLDTVQRIVDALARTGEPKMTSVLEVDPERDDIIGEVPMHLRHLHNLVLEMQDEAKEAENPDPLAAHAISSAFDIFCVALSEHVPLDNEIYQGTKLCTDWQVAGVKRVDFYGLKVHGFIFEL